jgi:hypothetical protein
MTEALYKNIFTLLTNQTSSEISFTSAWKGYEIDSTEMDNDLVKEIGNWFHESFIHALIDLDLASEKLNLKFFTANKVLYLDVKFIFRNENWSREDIYQFSNLIGDPIIKLISENCKLDKESIDCEEIEINFYYSSQDSILNGLNINYQNEVIVLTEPQANQISAFILNIIEKWDVSENRTVKLSNVFTEIYSEYKTISAETHGNATFKITTDSICLI